MSEDLKSNMEASMAAGPLHVAHGGVVFNAPHIDYWKNRALKAEKALAESNQQMERYASERNHYRSEKFRLEAELYNKEK